jgi:hypothetical protein
VAKVVLNSHLAKINFIAQQQYGFRARSNTLTATVDLVTNIKTNIDQKKYVLGVFIDLKKAFDTVSHNLLIEKLENLGITGTAHNMFKSYLSNRTQVVKIGNYVSDSAAVGWGIPQGSILGPLLFSIYVNSVTTIGLTAQLTLYADDTCLFYFGRNLSDIINEAQADLNKYNVWCQSNLLTINTKKTSYMIFAAKNKNISQIPTLMINSDPIHRSNTEKYLGLLLDDKLTWKSHIQKVRSKISSLTGALRNCAGCIPYKARVLIYNSLVKSHLEYLIEVWGCAAKTNLQILQSSQNKLIKCLFKYHRQTRSKLLYSKTKLFNLKQLYTFTTCMLIRKILTHKIHTQITFTKRTFRHKLRNTNKIKLFRHRTGYGKKNILSEGAEMYNKLPKEIKECETEKLFKTKLSAYVYDKMY